MPRRRVLMALALGAVACGPSFQAVYECDVHFEHCYALDQTVAVPHAKRDCWAAWLHDYTYGQPRDRVDYATGRLASLSNDGKVAADVRASASAPAAALTVDAPGPTNAFAPPPNLAASAQPTDAGAFSVHFPAPHAPGEACADACGQKWTHCRIDCKDDACAGCDATYRTCMPLCFQ